MNKKHTPWLTILFGTLSLLLACTTLYCRAEWLDTRRQLDRQRDLTDAAKASSTMWENKYNQQFSRKRLTARQQKLLVRYEAAQARK